MSDDLPFAPGAARLFLLADPSFLELISAEHVTTREVPDPLRHPCMTIQATVNRGVDPMLRRPLLQIDTYTPKHEIIGGDIDPEVVSWRIAARAGRLLGRAKNIEFDGASWSGHWVEGPVTMVDRTRGVDHPLYRALIRVELKMRTPRS